MADLLRQAVYNRLAGTKTRTMPSGYRKTQPPAHWFGTNLGARSRARLQSFKTELLRYESISGLAAINRGADCPGGGPDSQQRQVLARAECGNNQTEKNCEQPLSPFDLTDAKLLIDVWADIWLVAASN